MTSVLARLLAAPGVYWGAGSGPESGDFIGRIEVRPILGGVTIDYEAWSEREGLQHREHALLTDSGPTLRLHVLTSEMGLGLMFEEESKAGNFVLRNGPDMRVVIEHDEDTLSYAWCWAPESEQVREQSRLVARRVS